MCHSLPREPRISPHSQSPRPRPPGARVSTSSRPAAFTLVELLVVIGIIALLIGILVPVIARAREQARVVQCASNIRQIYHAMVMYANEHKGTLPNPVGHPANNKPFSAIWVPRWGEYDWERGTLWPYIPGGPRARQELFLCPSDGEPRYASIMMGLPLPDPDTSRNFSYNFNTHLIVRGFSWGNVWGMKMTEIRKPWHKILIYEMRSPGSTQGGPATFDPSVGEIVVLLSTRHNGRANEGFADGHVEVFDPSVFAGKVSGANGLWDNPAYRRFHALGISE